MEDKINTLLKQYEVECGNQDEPSKRLARQRVDELLHEIRDTLVLDSDFKHIIFHIYFTMNHIHVIWKNLSVHGMMTQKTYVCLMFGFKLHRQKKPQKCFTIVMKLKLHHITFLKNSKEFKNYK